MNNIFDTLFGTPVRTVATLVVIVGLLAFSYQGNNSKIAVSINENFAAGVDMALASDNPIIKAQCFGGKNARIFVSWNSNKGVIQKQIDGGAWTYLGSASPRTHYADWTATLGHTYAYRLRKPPASTAGAKYTFSNIATVNAKTATACTSLPIATVTNTTHASAFFTGDTINVSVIGEPNRPVQSCSRFIAAGSTASVVSCVPKTPTFDTRTSPDGTWTQTLTIGNNTVGAWTRYFIIAGRKSNGVGYSVLPLPTTTVSVVSPNGGESLIVGSTQTIEWTAQGVTADEMFGIRWKQGSAVLDNTTVTTTSDKRSADLIVPPHPGSDIKIEVVVFSDSRMLDILAKDDSDATFTIDEASEGLSTFTLINHVINDSGGTASASYFAVHVMKDGADVPKSPLPGSEIGTAYSLSPGVYTVSVDTMTGYSMTGISGDCASDGTVTISAGDNKTCTITNDDDVTTGFVSPPNILASIVGTIFQ